MIVEVVLLSFQSSVCKKVINPLLPVLSSCHINYFCYATMVDTENTTELTPGKSISCNSYMCKKQQ